MMMTFIASLLPGHPEGDNDEPADDIQHLDKDQDTDSYIDPTLEGRLPLAARRIQKN